MQGTESSFGIHEGLCFPKNEMRAETDAKRYGSNAAVDSTVSSLKSWEELGAAVADIVVQASSPELGVVELAIPVSTGVAADSVLAVAARSAGQRVEFGQHYCQHCVPYFDICTKLGRCLSSPCNSRPRRDVMAFTQSDLAFPCRVPYTTASRKLAPQCANIGTATMSVYTKSPTTTTIVTASIG